MALDPERPDPGRQFEAAEANGREAELAAELDALFNEENTSDDATSIPATFLRVTVVRNGGGRN